MEITRGCAAVASVLSEIKEEEAFVTLLLGRDEKVSAEVCEEGEF